MRATVYCLFVRYRSWTTEGQVFATPQQRTAALRALAEDEDENLPQDASEDDLVEILGQHDHEVHLFDGPITVAIYRVPRSRRTRNARKRGLHHHTHNGGRAS